MGRRVRSFPLETRTARLRLKQRSDPYFVNLGGGLHLGYRKRASGGSWLARRRGGDGRYREEGIGLADDFRDSDGAQFITYGEAQQRAHQWAGVQRAAELGNVTASGKYTVAEAMADYLADYRVRGKGVVQTDHVVRTKILPDIGEVPLSKLSTVQLRRWLNSIADAPSMKKGGNPRTPSGGRDEALRRRRSSANRVLSVLKAALNFAFHQDRVFSNAAWVKVRPFKSVDAPVVRFLTEPEALRLINGSDEDFRDLVKGALLSGCRYGELTRLRCGDINVHARTISIQQAKGGTARHAFLTDEGAAFFAQLTAGRSRGDFVFRRSIGRAWRKSEQLRPMARACERAQIVPAASFHILRHTHGSWLALKGVPLQVIAKQLGHADVRMTERHYAHLLPSYVSDTIRTNLPSLGLEFDRVSRLDRVSHRSSAFV